ncbi:MAG: ABC-ATPase domain-containing protein, partial [Lachnospiraceae bacterium]|nr:ABC-ATPase domain-containing protein [Lachnospiraceae bacterium]
MKSSEDLRTLLERIDHRSYPAYKDTAGSYQFGGYVLSIDHVQGDPFASPSDVSIHVPAAVAGFPAEEFDK